mmetsp:Transcript_31520/g.46766  ORF Transcript_31520/g.46766 Transcript_31520/m.46766 type:complete len:204 (+) Transcript_31520:341-952(+)
METVTLKHISSMQSTIVVNQQHVAWLHTQRCNVFFRSSFDFLAILQRKGLHRICVENFRHSHFWHTAWSPVAQLASMIVRIVEPDWHSGDGMTIDGTFRCFDCLKTTGFAVSFVNHLQIHVKLRCDGSIHGSLDPLLGQIGQGRWNVKIGHGNTNLTIVQLLQELRVHFRKNSCSIGHQKASATLGGALKAHKGCVCSCSLRC